MKLSVSLSDEDVATLDDEISRSNLPGRSAAVAKAIALLRASALGDAYEQAWDESEPFGEEASWAAASEDGRA